LFRKSDGFSITEVAVSLAILGLATMGLFSISKYVFKGTKKVQSSNLMSTVESKLLSALSSPAFYETAAPVEGLRVRDRLLDGTLTAIVVSFDGDVIADTRGRMYHNVLSGAPCNNPATDPACSVYVDLGIQKFGTAWKIAYRIGAVLKEGLPVAALGAPGQGPALAASDYGFLIPEGFYRDLGELVCGAGQILDGYRQVGSSRVAACRSMPTQMSCPVGQYPVGFTKIDKAVPAANIGGSQLIGSINVECQDMPRLACPVGYGIQSINARDLLAKRISGVTCVALTTQEIPIRNGAHKIACPAGYVETPNPRRCTLQFNTKPATQVGSLAICTAPKQWIVDEDDPAEGRCCNPASFKTVKNGVCKP
jgi:hypothetical protein